MIIRKETYRTPQFITKPTDQRIKEGNCLKIFTEVKGLLFSFLNMDSIYMFKITLYLPVFLFRNLIWRDVALFLLISFKLKDLL